MIYFTVVFLCTAGLFLGLLEDKFKLWVTVSTACVGYFLALAAAFVVRRLTWQPVLAQQVPCAVGSLIFLAVSMVVHSNNFADKLFVAILSVCNFNFISFFVPLVLGILPNKGAGAFAGVFSIGAYLLFTLLCVLCLYRPMRHFSDRGVSGFMLGMCGVGAVLCALALGAFDFLFRTNVIAARLLCCVAVYAVLVFAFRSVYHAGKFREQTAVQSAWAHMLEMESGDFADMLAAVREVRAAQKAGEYALDTVCVMLADGAADSVPAYVAAAKRSAENRAILQAYHENPYLNAVIATKAAFAAQNGIAFECNAVTGNSPLQAAELCVIINELLTRACNDAAGFNGERKLRFTAFPGDGTLKLETVYSAVLPEKERFSMKGKKLSDLFTYAFDDNSGPDPILHGLENTEEIIERYSGRLTVSAAGENEVILQAVLNF